MIRPGPKTRLEEVKRAIVDLLRENSDGLSFNELFRKLKEQRVLGSYSVLSSALKELCGAGVTEYKDTKTSGYRIPKRVYRLSDSMEQELRNQHLDAKRKQAISLDKIILDKQLLNSVFFTHLNNLISAYRILLNDNDSSDPNARWRLILDLESNYMRVFMNEVANTVSKGKTPIDKANKVAHEVQTSICTAL